LKPQFDVDVTGSPALDLNGVYEVDVVYEQGLKSLLDLCGSISIIHIKTGSLSLSRVKREGKTRSGYGNSTDGQSYILE